MRYFFHLNCASGLLRDIEGQVFDSTESAVAHAMALADKLEAEREGTRFERFVVVVDELGEDIAQVLVGTRRH